MKKHKGYLFSIVVLSILLLCFSVISFGQERSLEVAIDTPLQSLDPMGQDTTTIFGTLQNIYDALWSRTARGELEGALCKSWERKDPKTWILHLRENVKFHNGNAFTAEDVKFSLKRSIEWEGSEFTVIGGRIEKMQILDDHTLKVVTTDPWPTFVDTAFILGIMDKDWTESHTKGYISTHAMGTGAYKFVEWKPEAHLTLVANKDYWRGVPSIKNVTFLPISQAATRLVALKTGKADLISFVPLNSVGQVKDDPDTRLITEVGRRVIFLGFNQKEGFPTSKLKVRKAIYHAIDENTIVEKIMNGYAKPATQLLAAPGGGCNPSIERLEYNPEKAKELLAEAGYPNGFEMTFDVPNNRYPKDQQIGLAIVQMLRKVGLKVELDAQPKSIHFSDVIDENTNFWLMGWREMSMDIWRTFAKHVHTSQPEAGFGGWNAGDYHNEKVDELLEKANRELDLEKRNSILQRANKMAMEEVAYIPLHIQYDIYGACKEIKFETRATSFILARAISFVD